MAGASGAEGSRAGRRTGAVAVILVTLGLVVALIVRDQMRPGLSNSPAPNVDLDRVPVPSAIPRAPHGAVLPEDFGALGDGVSDDHDALQAALDEGAGGVVWLTPGRRYISTQALFIQSDTTLAGRRGSVLAFTWAAVQDANFGGPFYLGNADQFGGNSNITLTGFSIEGAGDGLPAGPNTDTSAWGVPAIRLRLVDGFEISHLEVTRSPSVSILYQGSTGGLIARNHVHDSGRDGITGTWFQSNLEDIWVVDNLIERVGDDGVAIAGSTTRMSNSGAVPQNITIARNRIVGWQSDPNGMILGRGIAILAARDVIVANNTVDRTAGSGIMVRGSPNPSSLDPATGLPWRSSDITIVGNLVSDPAFYASTSILDDDLVGGTAIEVDRASGVALARNTFGQAGGETVAIGDCVGCTIE